MFRDREELPASGDMDASIKTAISQSEFMIVICSEASARSVTVNSEIRQFVALRDSGNILCYIVDGEPSFDAPGINKDIGCIPPEIRKLRLLTGLTPLAADARPSKDGRNAAVQKLAAGMLGVELDELIRRSLRRKNTRLMAATAASFVITLAVSALLLRATIAEEEAQAAKSEAELQQARAENLIAFMLVDLTHNTLQELGRIDVIDDVVEKIVEHYEDQDDRTLSPEALGRKTRSYVQMGRLYIGRGMPDSARELFDYAYETTSELYARYPESKSAIYDHGVSLYWVGLNNLYNGRYSEAEKAWRDRAIMSDVLWERGGHTDIEWSTLGDVHVHLGWALMEMGRYEEAEKEFEIGLAQRQFNVDRRKEDIGWFNHLGGGYYHLQWAQLYTGKYKEAYENALKSNRLYRILAIDDPEDQRAVGNYARSLRWVADTELALGKIADARKHLNESLEHHGRLLAFEPKNSTFRYNACVAMVMLAELEWSVDDTESAQDVMSGHCLDHVKTLSLGHFTTHNRLYGYRLALLKLDMAFAKGDIAFARALHEAIDESWRQESLEVQNSVQGQLVGFKFTLLSAALNVHSPSVIRYRQQLVDALTTVEKSPMGALPSSAPLLHRARQLMAQMPADSEFAR